MSKNTSENEGSISVFLECTSTSTTALIKQKFQVRLKKGEHSSSWENAVTDFVDGDKKSRGWTRFREYLFLKEFLTNDSLTIEAFVQCLSPKVSRFANPFSNDLQIKGPEFDDTDIRSKSWDLLDNSHLSDIEPIVGPEDNAKKFFGHRHNNAVAFERCNNETRSHQDS